MSTVPQFTGVLEGSYSWTDTLQGVYFGPGSLKTALPKLLDTLGAKKALIVTGNSLYNKVCDKEILISLIDFLLTDEFIGTIRQAS